MGHSGIDDVCRTVWNADFPLPKNQQEPNIAELYSADNHSAEIYGWTVINVTLYYARIILCLSEPLPGV